MPELSNENTPMEPSGRERRPSEKVLRLGKKTYSVQPGTTVITSHIYFHS